MRADYSGYLFAVLVSDCKQTERIICRGKESKKKWMEGSGQYDVNNDSVPFSWWNWIGGNFFDR